MSPPPADRGPKGRKPGRPAPGKSGGGLVRFRERRRQRGRRQALARQRADALHQVRNALATLTLQAELAATSASDADRHAIVLAMRERLAQLQRFLSAREAEADRFGANIPLPRRTRHARPLPPFDLAALAREVVDEWQAVALQQHVLLRMIGSTDFPVWAAGHCDALREAVGNVVANAIEHTPAGGRVDVSVGDTTSKIVSLRVADSGRGVAPKSRKRIFSRQFRNVDWCDATHSGSRGIGLDLVYRIVKESLGKTEACDGFSRPDGGVGLTIVITLGRSKSPTDGAAQQHVE